MNLAILNLNESIELPLASPNYNGEGTKEELFGKRRKLMSESEAKRDVRSGMETGKNILLFNK